MYIILGQMHKKKKMHYIAICDVDGEWVSGVCCKNGLNEQSAIGICWNSF